jgi:hypothetical protein
MAPLTGGLFLAAIVVHVCAAEPAGGHEFACADYSGGKVLIVSRTTGYLQSAMGPAGRVVMEIKAPGGPHSAIRLKDGNTLIATGDSPKNETKVFEVEAAAGDEKRTTKARRREGQPGY